MEDRREFELIFRAYYTQLFVFAHQFVADDEECHDLVSQAYEGVWNHFAEVNAQTVRAYLYRAVRNHALNYLRQQVQLKQYTAFSQRATAWVEDADLFSEEEDRKRIVRQVLDSLDQHTRDIFVACYVEGKKYKEVAEERGVTVSTVKKHMVRALKTIRQLREKSLKQ